MFNIHQHLLLVGFLEAFMLTSTLGGLIKDYRIKKRLSQMEVSLRIGWKDTTRLSKIEQGRVGKPTRETIEKVIKALDLNGQEKGEFLLIGGYLPTDEEIKRAIKKVKDKIDNWPYPAYLIDFSWRNLYVNPSTWDVHRVSVTQGRKLTKGKVNILELAFTALKQKDIVLTKGQGRNASDDFVTSLIAQFKIETHGHENEKWYTDIVRRLMQYDEFYKLWPQVKIEDYDKELLDYEYKEIGWLEEKRVFKFHLFVSRLMMDQRFQIVFYVPADNQTARFFLNKIFMSG